MSRRLKIVAISVVIVCLLAAGLIFAAGAIAAENALHPPGIPVAKVCPCFAHMSCQSVSVTARDGVKLNAWYYWPDSTNGKTVLLLHGVGSNRADMVPLAGMFLRHGYTILAPDLRGHGESGGLATYGVAERGDVGVWLDWLQKSRNSHNLYGFGASLGGSVLLSSLDRETRFRAVVAESSYYDFPSIADERIARLLPDGLKWLTIPFVDSGLAWVRWRHGIDLREASAANGLRATNTPVLLIHGLADNRTAPENSRRLASADSRSQLWLVPNSHHADAWSTDRIGFENRVTGWFSTY